MKSIILTSLLAVILLLGCNTNIKTKQSSDIDNLKKQKEWVTEKYWKLIKLYGVEIEMVENQEREIFFRLTSDGRVEGFGGCNPISGTYELQEGLRIGFDKMAMGLKFCSEGIPETAFLEVLNIADNYSLSEDKETLYLNKAKMAPLAVFKSIVFN